LTSTVNGFAAAVGFAIVAIIFATIRERIAFNNIPESFKGIPILLLTTGLMALAFFGLSSLL
jgi:electron transport complex protein RnfA